MLKLKRLTIHKFPRVKPGTELVFNDGFNVLLGVNGSGKTTLLKLVCNILAGRFDVLRDGDLHVSYALEDGPNRCTVDARMSPRRPKTVAARAPHVDVDVQISLPGHAPISVRFIDDEAGITYGEAAIERAKVSTRYAPPISAALAQLEEAETLDDAALALIPGVLAVEPVRFDESTHWFESQFASDGVSLHRLPSGEVYPFPSYVLPPAVGEALAAEIDATELDEYRVDQERLPFLREASNALGLKDASLYIGLMQREPDDTDGTRMYEFGNPRLYFTKTDGTRLLHEQLSFGQQRLLAFYFFAAIHSQILVADELTNGMHHSMIASCIDLIGDRQAFLATQNPLLLDNLGFESAEAVRRTFILCSTEQDNGREQMVWRNMTAQESENFYRDYKVGISHVNDILRSWGLW